jgi:hypothetical protein
VVFDVVTLAVVSDFFGVSTLIEVVLDVVEGDAGSVVTVVVELEAGGGVVVLGTTTVVSRDAVVAGTSLVVVVEVVVERSHAVSAVAPRARAATRGISFMCSPWKW